MCRAGASAAAVAVALSLTPPVRAQVPVRHTEGLVHGFLALRTLEGSTLADGDLIQNASGARVTTRLVFHFNRTHFGRLRQLIDRVNLEG